MPLRCLLFSSSEEMVQPILQVLTDLGIEGEYCRSAVDAVEKVTTQLFQIVITDWDDQPEATFLLKTARDQRAAQRPLTLAIVSDDARLPEALQAGANSVLVKPIRAEQVRDTMSTACELLRAKQPSSYAATRGQRAEIASAGSACQGCSRERGGRCSAGVSEPKYPRKPFGRENSCNPQPQRPGHNSTRNAMFRSRWTKPQPRRWTHSRSWSRWPLR